MSNPNNNLQTQTSNVLHNVIMESGGKDRPPMLAPGNYVQWKSRLKRYIDTKPNKELLPHCLTNPPYEYKWIPSTTSIAEDDHTHRINNDIYSTVDACPNACKMWKEIERLKQAPAMDAEDDEMSKEKEIDKLMALISLSFKKIYKPTNNNLRTSSNTSRANQDNSPRVNRGTGYDNQRAVNVVGARDTVGQKPKRARDSAYHKEKMLLCKKEEAGIQLSAEQVDWRDDTDDEPEDQELEAHYMYMSNIQEVSPDAATNSGPIFDFEPFPKVQYDDDHYNVFANERTHLEKPESINDKYSEEQCDNHVIIDSLDMGTNGQMDDQDDDDLANERELLASLIDKLKCEIDDSKKHNKLLESSNKILVDKLKSQIEDFINKNKSLESSNTHFKEANNELQKTNQMMVKDLVKFQDEIQKHNDVKYMSKVELDCAKAQTDLMTYKIESQKSMKKEAQKQLYKTREDKELEKVIVLEKKIKVLDDIVYKTGQSVQTMNMLNQNYKTSFVKPEFLKKAQRANPRLYDIGCYNDNLALMLAPKSDNSIRLACESRSKLSDLIKPFDYKHLNSLYDLFVPQREKSAEQKYFSNESHTPATTVYSKETFSKQTMLLKRQMDESVPYVDSLKLQLETQKTQFLNEIDCLSREYYYADHMNAILGVYTKLDEVTELQCDYLDQVAKCDLLEKELSTRPENVNNKSFTELSKRFFELEKHVINLELALQQKDLKAQIQDKDIAISELKKLVAKLKGKSVDAKLEKPSVIRQPNAFKSQRQSILGKSATLSDSLARKYFSKSKSVTKNDVSKVSSKPVPAQILPQNVKSIVKNTNVIAPGMYKMHTKPSQTRTPQLPQDSRKTNKRMFFSTRVIHTTSVSRPRLKSNQLEDSVMPNNSQGKKQQVEDHRRNPKFSKNKTSVTVCDDSLNVKTSNVNFVGITCGNTRESKRTVNQSVATFPKKTVATESTTKKPRSIIRKQYEKIRKTCRWWYSKITPTGYTWKPKCGIVNVKENVSMPLGLIEIILFTINFGCSKYMMGNLKLLTNFVEKFLGTVKFGNDQIAPILSYGDLVKGNITITWVYYVEGLNHNLFFIGQFCDADLEVAFRKSTCYVHDLKGNDLLTGSHSTDLYSITLQNTSTPNPIFLMAKATSSQTWLWHRRLSHLNFDTINLLSKNDIVTSLPKLRFVKDQLCSSCELGKAKRKYFHTKITLSSKRWLQLLHMDLCDPMRVESINGKKYVLKQFPLHVLLRTVNLDGKNLDKIKEKGDACIFVGYSTTLRAYRVYNKRTRMIVETIHVNFDESPQMASDHVSSDPVPQCPTMALEHDSLSFDPQSQEHVPQADETSFDVPAADTSNQRQQKHTTPSTSIIVAADTTSLIIQSTPKTTCQAPTVTATENIDQAEIQ
ncbi:retrovirus-related pol polyprotein from transposon TNT 1-94 [Tanacetum coccineum]|uniref:Retrovirus-related pol polyprotein from transposon TNT 1-94 n=1 Tax=Tanacetum coccineum TaxID=301880 RepID=A0ABQ5IY06_9ASTR